MRAQPLTDFREELTERYESLRHDIERPLLPPETLYLETEETDSAMRACALIEVQRAEALDNTPASI